MYVFILFCRHEDPEGTAVTSTDASQYNVQRWVGAHIIPVCISVFPFFFFLPACTCSLLFNWHGQAPKVDFTSSEPYDTLTAGATITFSAIRSERCLPHEPIIDSDSDAGHLGTLKGKVKGNTDATQLKAVKGCPHLEASSRVCCTSFL